MRQRVVMSLLTVAALCAAQARAQEAPALDAATALRASQGAIGRTVGDYTLLDREGRPVSLASFRGRPLLVSFIYTGCFQACPTATRSLQEAVRGLQARFGADRFRVVSIGFNQPADSPQAMKSFALQHRVAQPGWDFLSPPPAIVPALTRDFGFLYQATPAGFDHLLQVSVVDGEGRIVRQVYGDALLQALDEPMRSLLAGAPLASPAPVADLFDRVRALCTVYDPKTGTYRVDWSLPLEIAGGITFIVAVAWFMLGEWRAQRRARRTASQS